MNKIADEEPRANSAAPKSQMNHTGMEQTKQSMTEHNVMEYGTDTPGVLYILVTSMCVGIRFVYTSSMTWSPSKEAVTIASSLFSKYMKENVTNVEDKSDWILRKATSIDMRNRSAHGAILFHGVMEALGMNADKVDLQTHTTQLKNVVYSIDVKAQGFHNDELNAITVDFHELEKMIPVIDPQIPSLHFGLSCHEIVFLDTRQGEWKEYSYEVTTKVDMPTVEMFCSRGI